MLIVAWREITSGDSGVNLVTSRVSKSCIEKYISTASSKTHHFPSVISLERTYLLHEARATVFAGHDCFPLYSLMRLR